jgi:hypothetical protein
MPTSAVLTPGVSLQIERQLADSWTKNGAAPEKAYLRGFARVLARIFAGFSVASDCGTRVTNTSSIDLCFFGQFPIPG